MKESKALLKNEMANLNSKVDPLYPKSGTNIQGDIPNSPENTFFRLAVPLKYKNAQLHNNPLITLSYAKFGASWAKNPRSLFLVGGYGTGKTYFAFAILREMFRVCPRHIWPRYFTSPELDSKLLNALKSDDGDQFFVNDIASQDLLFIDDLGRETKSDRLRRQYFEILNYRYINLLPTILTSNYTLDQLGEIIDGSIASRMQEWDFLEFKGPDLRRNTDPQ